MKKVLSKSGKREVRTLSISEREHLRTRIAEDRAYLESFKRPEPGENPDVHISPAHLREVDTSAVEARIRRREEQLKRQSPERLKGHEANRALKRMKELKERMEKRLLTTYEMGAYPSATDPVKQAKYVEACEKAFQLEVGNAEHQKDAREYQELAKRLDPDNPELSNIERLRSRQRY